MSVRRKKEEELKVAGAKLALRINGQQPKPGLLVVLQYLYLPGGVKTYLGIMQWASTAVGFKG